MTCRECLEQLPEQLESPRLEIERHLHACPACRREAGLLRHALAVLEGDRPQSAPDLRAAVWAGIAARREAVPAALRRERRLAAGLAAALAVGLAGALCWYAPLLHLPTAAGWLPALRDGLAGGWWQALVDTLRGLPGAGRELWLGLSGAVRGGWSVLWSWDTPALPVSGVALASVAVFCAAVAEAMARGARGLRPLRQGGR
ncbi:MAG: hypothetical protein HYU66_07555 [Armatimonadetes bacterium]|nr:hypothetical protein [Armatimonadota bacterium]